MNRRIMYIATLVLIVLHQDVWFWTDTRLLFGFMPIGLAYHALISILAGCLGAWACYACWPREIEDDDTP